MKRSRVGQRVWPATVIAVFGIIVGTIYVNAISANFIHYLIWRITSPAPFKRGHVRVGGADIHYVTCGRGPAVLLLHGGLSNRLSWFSQIPWLVDSGRQVVLPDTRGHGDSALGGHELSYRLLAADAVGILDRLAIAKTDVIGWSDGGNTALLLGRYWPQRIRRMVVISANFNPHGLTPEVLKENDQASRGIEHWWKRWWTGAGERLRELEKRVRKMWRTRPKLDRADLEQIRAPTLVIVGEKDVVSVSHARRMAEWLANGSLAVVPGGHYAPVTQARRVNALIAEFLDAGPRDDGS